MTDTLKLKYECSVLGGGGWVGGGGGGEGEGGNKVHNNHILNFRFHLAGQI
jgi:hypothetical protein